MYMVCVGCFCIYFHLFALAVILIITVRKAPLDVVPLAFRGGLKGTVKTEIYVYICVSIARCMQPD